MAKKKATKKKAAAVKVKATKATKPKKVEKAPAKKISSKTTKPAATKPKAVKTDKKTVKPALMSKKVSKKPEVEVSKPVAVVEKKTSKNVISIIESESAPVTEEAKVEKVSKVKPVKVDRGNLADEKAKWAELYKKYGKDKALSYKMTEEYPALVPLQHKVLGWGFILTNENSRLEVLFENGIRMLISNYKS
ncbi:hypothetical protein [Pseudobdellovibrio exovorus]|uniref:Uncharacterized protein n=1 Tax=Pseudobdellovibrio exovorus JSS TaxID=1184267 RepID=M4VAH5_9BACT|nr:hypothetical protein [Pseudobdellovibrio exovorus]AGH95001.1 hypothetical protein A11Q_783 [Pseudobdellovibrio exovorus JSS]